MTGVIDRAPKRIVVLHNNPPGEWRWIAHHLPEYCWEFVHAPPANGGVGNKVERLQAAANAARLARGADLILTFDEGLCAALVIARMAIRNGPPLISYYFNFSRLPAGFKRKRQAFLYRQVDRFVVSSTMERRLYADHFGIDPNRFDFIPWGVNPPVASDFQTGTGDYVCAVGGNARDYPLLMQVAADRPHIRFVVVARPANLAGLAIPPNVEPMCNIPASDAMAVVEGARIMALPLLQTDSPCGHVTIVSAFYLGTPIVVTGSSGVEDYVIDNETGLVAEAGSADAMGAAIDRLWNDPALANRIGSAARAFAQAHCTEQNYPAHVRRLLGD